MCTTIARGAWFWVAHASSVVWLLLSVIVIDAVEDACGGG